MIILNNSFSLSSIPLIPLGACTGMWDMPDINYYTTELIEKFDRLIIILKNAITNGMDFDFMYKGRFDIHYIKNLRKFTFKFQSFILALKHVNGWKGRIGLALAIVELKKFKENNDFVNASIPRFKGILNAINKGYWVNYGIQKGKWNDLIIMSFGKSGINKLENKYYMGEIGLIRASTQLKEYYDIHKQYPTAKGFTGISKAVSKGYWIEFGIRKDQWNDLMKHVFGQKLDKFNRKPNGYYNSIKGLAKAKFEVIEYSKQNGIPSCRNKKMSKIYNAIKQGYWIKYGIGSWNDFIEVTFGNNAIKKKSNDYFKGIQGLNNAVREGVDLYLIESKITTKNLRSIYNIILRKDWVGFGIVSWSDYKNKVIEEVENNGK